MQDLDLPCNTTHDPPLPDLSTMSDHSLPPIQYPAGERTSHVEFNSCDVKLGDDDVEVNTFGKSKGGNRVIVKRERLTRACTQRAAARMQAAAEAEAELEAERKRRKVKKRETTARRLLKNGDDNEFGEEENGLLEVGNADYIEEDDSSLQAEYSKIVTPLVGELELSQMPRWNIRSMWELASILNFLNVFRPLLNIRVEFSAEELETALITPNTTLADIHMPLLKAIPPIARMALGVDTWITGLCRKLRHWWHWVAEGDLPIVASHGAEIEAYNALDPAVRVVILKALCDIRVEQEDIKNYIDGSIKQGVHLSTFRKERIGGNSHGILYWYEDDPVIGHRLYRETRKIEVKKGKGRNVPPIPRSSYQWEAVATNLDEFLNVSHKLFSSKNHTEASVGKKLRDDMLPEIERVQKRKEKLLKKQQREAFMIDNMMNMDFAAGRSRRDRKPVSYTYDDYDRSISEAIKATKKQQQSPEYFERRDPTEFEVSTNDRWADDDHDSFNMLYPNLADEQELYDDHKTQTLDHRSNQQKQRPQRYSVNNYLGPVSDNEADFEIDDDIVGEVVYVEEYLRRKKQRIKTPRSSEGDDDNDGGNGDDDDDEYCEDEDNPEEDEEEEEDEEDDDDISSEDSDEPRRSRTLRSHNRREDKSRSVDNSRSGLRRSKRATRNRVNYRQIEMSESETEFTKPNDDSSEVDEQSDAYSDNAELSMDSQESEDNKIDEPHQMDVDQPTEDQHLETADKEELEPQEPLNIRDTEDGGGVKKQRFLDLNELAPCSGFDDGLDFIGDEDGPFDF